MAEYIEKSVLLEAFTNADHPIQYPDGSHGLGLGYADFRAILFDLPAADVVERKTGKWEYKPSLYPYGVEHFECSLCGESVVDRTNFCPYCGADMRGEDNG